MPDAREIIAAAARQARLEFSTSGGHIDQMIAGEVFAALRGAGLLAEPGGETRVEWAIRGVRTGRTRTFTTREAAEHYLTLVPAGEFDLVTIRTTWVQPTDTKEPSPDA